MPPPAEANPVPLGTAAWRMTANLFADAASGSVNSVVSPVGVGLVLSMLHQGSGGETARQLARTVGADDGRAAPAALYSEARRSLQGAAAAPAVLHMAMGAWFDASVPPTEAYAHDLGALFDSPPKSLAFAHVSAAAAAINTWVQESTAGALTRLVEPSDLRDSTAVLASALYFHAPWADSLALRRRSGTFTGPSGTASVPIFATSKPTRLAYGETDAWQAVALPYAGDRLALILVLPAPAQPSLDWEAVHGATVGLKSELVTLQAPVFNLHAERDVRADLVRAGVTAPFDAAADFRRMTTGAGTVATKVVHQAMIGVDEHGTTAAAATGAHMGVLALPLAKEVRVDRPFYFVLQDLPSGLPLFVGHVVKPGTP